MNVRKSIKKIKSYLILTCLACSVLYLLSITIVALITYLHNRPYKISAMAIAVAIVLLIHEQIQQTSNTREQRHTKR